MNEVYIVSAVRTAIGGFGGGLAGVSATKLGAAAIKGALDKINLAPNEVQEVLMGCVIQANLGQAPARQAAKFAGLPDVVRNTFNLPHDQLITPNIENKSLLTQAKAIHTICQPLGVSIASGYRSYYQAKNSWKSNLTSPISGLKIAVIGHSYLLNDAFFCRDILSLLSKRGITIITPAHISSKILYQESTASQSDIYWQLSAKIDGAVRYFSHQPDIKGIIMVSSFGCGPDSLLNEYVEYHILKNSSKPYIILNLDEHTGNAGMITRMEAFLDLMDWRL